jgi:hypothetical protein
VRLNGGNGAAEGFGLHGYYEFLRKGSIKSSSQPRFGNSIVKRTKNNSVE